jgi:hypothetical protein
VNGAILQEISPARDIHSWTKINASNFNDLEVGWRFKTVSLGAYHN